jgi:hypothetical protein
MAIGARDRPIRSTKYCARRTGTSCSTGYASGRSCTRDDAAGFVMVHAGIRIWDLDEAATRAGKWKRYWDRTTTTNCWRKCTVTNRRDGVTACGSKRLRVIINYLTRMRVIDVVGGWS